MIRAVIDLNVLISAFILARGLPYQVLTAWKESFYTLLSSEGMIVGLEGKLRAPRLAHSYQLSSHDIAAFTTLLRAEAELVSVPASELRSVTGDPEDDLVLTTGRLARADCLVTGDRRLLGLARYEGMAITTPRQFLAGLEGSRLS